MRCAHFDDYFAGNVKNLNQLDKNYSHYQIDLLKLNLLRPLSCLILNIHLIYEKICLFIKLKNCFVFQIVPQLI